MDKKRLPFIACSIAIIISVVIICFINLTSTPKYTTIPLSDDWTLYVNGKTYPNVSMKELFKSYSTKLTKGDRVIMTHTLPDVTIPNPVIAFRSRYTTLKVYEAEKLIFDFGMDFYIAGNFVGKMYHFIPLTSDYAGKTITLDMIVGEDDAFSMLDPPLFGTHSDLTGRFVRENLLIIATGIFMSVFGLTFLCIGIIFINFVPEVKSLLFGSLFCMNLSAWLLAYYNVLSLFIYTEYETQIEYFTMYLVVPYCYLILYYIEQLKGDKLFLAVMYISWGVPLLQYSLHFIFNIHLRVTLPLYHVTGVLGFSVLMYYAVTASRHKDSANPEAIVQLTGLLVFAISEILHLVIYACDILHIPTNQTINRVIIATGCIFFAMCQLATYLVYITATYAKKRENVSLSHLAYADGLTNLANRSKADQKMEELNSATDDYCIMSVDLNGLKDVNDKYGHPSGDRYIKEFAKVLCNTFGNDDFCARIGGDEFLIILRDANTKDIHSLIGRMTSALNVMNALYPEYKRSVSTGFAFRHEVADGNSHEVYLLADQRMYENKRIMHQELGIHARL